MTELIETGSKKVRGMAQKSLALIDAMHAAAEAAHPITGRGIGYKLFVASLIASMATSEMARVYRLLKEARERGIIPWDWVCDETRELERCAVWDDPEQYARAVSRSYRRDFWNQQPCRVEVWSEKGTVRGVLAPVLDEYAVGFRVVHGFSGATTIHDVAEDCDGRPLIILYVGDFDPSGLCMSAHDIPTRLAKYDGDHVILKRIALRREHTAGLPSFSVSDKKKDPRYKWFVQNFGNQCWELDALDPNYLRVLVEEAIQAEIEPIAWARCDLVNKAEQEFPAHDPRQMERRAMMIHTPGSVRRAQRRLDRLNRRDLRVEEVVADMAAGLALHRGLDRFRRVQWTLSDGDAVDDSIAREVIRHLDIVGCGDTLFPQFGELSQTFRFAGDE